MKRKKWLVIGILLGFSTFMIYCVMYFKYDMFIDAETMVKRAMLNPDKVPEEQRDKLLYMLAEKKRMEETNHQIGLTATANTRISYYNTTPYTPNIRGEDATVQVYLHASERNHLNIPLRHIAVMYILLKKKNFSTQWEIVDVLIHPFVYSGGGFGHSYPIDLYDNLDDMIKSLEVE